VSRSRPSGKESNAARGSAPPDSNAAIRIHYGTLALQFGIGNVPNLFLRFYRHLVHTPAAPQGHSLHLSDAEAMLLVHVMALRSDDDFQLRLSNLPLLAPLRTRVDYLGKLRRMGLVFTSRIYYSRAEMIAHYGFDNLPDTPRMRAQQWDLSSLIYNLSRVAYEYLKRQREAVSAWNAGGQVGPRPVTELPADYQHEIVLPEDVTANIRVGVENPDRAIYFPVPVEWKQRACVPAEKASVRDAVPAEIAPVQAAYLRDSGRSSMSTPSVLTPEEAGGPTGGPLAPDPPDYTSDALDAGKERAARTAGLSGNDDLQRDLSVARASDTAPSRDAAREPSKVGANVNEPLPARRERVLRDLREHADDRRTQIYIVAVNIGQMLGLRWVDGQLRTQPIKQDKAEIGKMCREYGGPAYVWTVACRVAGHEIVGDSLDYLWGALRFAAQRDERHKMTLAEPGNVFDQVDYTRFEYDE
jgi:hypothetical protein